MNVGEITEAVVRDALWAIRYGRPLTRNALVSLDAVTVRLRTEGVEESARTREWMVGRLLDDLVADALARTRPANAGAIAGGQSLRAEIERLRVDFTLGSPAAEAWSVLRARYLATHPMQMQEMADGLDVGARTLARRLSQGHEMLVTALRETEVAAKRELARAGGVPVHRRIVPDPTAGTARSAATTSALLAAVRDGEPIARLSPATLNEFIRRPVADMVQYRLSRIAEWSDPRHALDERFVGLTLLVDQGEDATGERWLGRHERFTNLREVLTDVADPALVLIGPPGCGKSTLLRRFETDAAAAGLRGGDQVVTFFVSLNAYRGAAPGDPPPAPGRWLAGEWARRFPSLPPLDDVLAEGRVVLLLDALNEMPHRDLADLRDLVLGWKRFLHEMAAQPVDNRVVFSCRALDYCAPLSTPELRVPQVRVEAMNDDQVRRFLEEYAPARSDALWARLAGTPQLDLLRSPYFLRLFVENMQATGTVATDRAALFTGFVRRSLQREIERDNPLFQPDALLAEHDYERVLSAKRWRCPHELPERGRLFPELAALAYGMQATGTTVEAAQVRAAYDDALALIGDERAADIVRAGEALGLLDEDRDRDEVLFRHQLLQEYFAARRLAVQPKPELVHREWLADRVVPSVDTVIDGLAPADALPGLPQTGWEETTLLAAAMAADTAAFVRRVSGANLVLAGRIAAQPEVLARLPDEVLSEIRWALVRRSRDREADLRERIACGDAFGDLGDPRYERRTGPDGEYLWPPMIEVPGGVYPIGDDEGIEWRSPYTNVSEVETAHVPRHAVAIAALRIGQFAVTNAEWACFVASGGYDDERWWDITDARRWRRGELANDAAKINNRFWRHRFRADPGLFDRMVEGGLLLGTEAAIERMRLWNSLDDEAFECALDAHWQASRRTAPTMWRDKRFNRPSQPVVGVCWYEARAYCNWLSAQAGLPLRLPTEVEWEAAARGRQARAYPWGEVFDRQRANTSETHVLRTTPVGVFVAGDTPAGIADMAGNTYEWTSSLWGEYTVEESPVGYRYPYDATDGREDPEAPPHIARIARGGSAVYYLVHARSASRAKALPCSADYDRGLRLVAPPG
jgi:formylglycine-generating enzyme required for sulfatase activity